MIPVDIQLDASPNGEEMRPVAFSCFLLAAVPAVPSTLLAGPDLPGTSGPEFQVSSSFPPRYSYYFMFGPAADLADTGEFVVVWATYQGGYLGAVAGRAFDSSGSPLAGEFDLGDGSVFHYWPESPDVVAGNGEFVVVWSSREQEDYDSEGYSIKGQRFDLQGNLSGPRLKLTPAIGEFNGEIGVSSDGSFVLVWDDLRFARARRFDAAGVPSWPTQTVAQGDDRYPDPDVVVDPLGSFTVVWSHRDTAGPDGIFGRRFDSSGGLLNPTFAVSEYPSGYQGQPALAARPDGGFVAVWASIQDGSSNGVFGRLFDGALQPISGEFLVNTTTSGNQKQPDVGSDDRGNFVVVWDSGPAIGGGDLVMGQRFDPAGNRVGGEFQIDGDITTGQRLPSIGMRGDGEFIVTWFSTSSPDSTRNSVRARRFCSTPNVSAPASLGVCEGESVQFAVQATGREPFSHQWRKDGLSLFDDGRISGSSSSGLSIASAEPADAGSYDCVVTDACEGPQSLVSTPAQLSVEPRPAEVAELTVTAEGGGSILTLTWTAAGNATDYVVRSDTMPGGIFADLVGTTAGPDTDLSVPMPPGTLFFLVAGHNPACGEGPLR